jgi:hypothetical protein
MNHKIKQTVFLSKYEVGAVKDLWKFKDEDGDEYTTFKPDHYPLNTPMEVAFIITEQPSKKGDRVFVNRRLYEAPSDEPVRKTAPEYDIPAEMKEMKAAVVKLVNDFKALQGRVDDEINRGNIPL